MATITVTVSDALGSHATGTVTVATSSVAVPVVTPINFSIAASPTSDELVGTIAFTGGKPTSWAIVGGDPNKSFAIYLESDGTAHLRTSDGTTAGGGGGPQPTNGTTYALKVTATNAGGASVAASIGVTVGTIIILTDANWPGQPSNPVGFAATPAHQPLFTSPTTWPGGTWPGAYPGSLGTPPTITSGSSPSNPNIYAFFDFIGAQDFTGLNNVTFIGCRFQCSQGTGTVNAVTFGNGTQNQSYFYCSFVPLVSSGITVSNFNGGPAWPASGTGIVTVGGSGAGGGQTASPYLVHQDTGYQCAIQMFHGGQTVSTIGPIIVDHCDVWGAGAPLALGNDGAGGVANPGYPGGVFITDNWLHDVNAGDDTQGGATGQHTNGIAATQGGGFTSTAGIVIRHNVVVSIGNTECIAFESSGPYGNITLDNNLLGGFGNIINIIGNPGATTTSNTFATNNQITTAVPWVNTPNFGDQSLATRWKNNTLNVYPGTTWGTLSGQTWVWSPSQNGQFVWPFGFGPQTVDF